MNPAGQDFLLIALGSHGDVHPFIGVGRGLRLRGHRVRLATNEYFKPLVENAGLEFVQMGDKSLYEQMMLNADLWHTQRGPKTVLEFVGRNLRQVYDMVLANASPQTFLAGSTLSLGAICAGEKHGYRMASIHLSPICIRSSVTMPVLPGGFNPNYLPRAVRRGFWAIADRWVIDPMICPVLNAFRAELRLPPVFGVQRSWWHAPALSIGLWPEWFFPRQPDYPEQVRLAGFPQYDESDHLALDPDLDSWLRAGDAPIAFTPGSAMRFGQSFFAAATDACVRLKRRGLLLTRHAEQIPANLPPTVRHVPFAPFGLLLPRCAAAVHHGGIGSLAQGLRAGIPQLIMPMSHDQFDNAAICKRLGVADWISVRKFTGKRVAQKLSTLLATAPSRCKAVAEKARQDRAIDVVCDLLENAARGERAAYEIAKG